MLCVRFTTVPRLRPLVLFAVASLVSGATGCGPSRPARIPAPPLDPAAVTAAVMTKADANGDGTLVTAELAAVPALVPALAALDSNQDGSLSAAELEAWLDEVKASKVAITSLAAAVTHKGRPVSGATVKLVPEPFMGGGMQPAEGTTDDTGGVMPTIPGGAYPGVNCGLYRVEISGRGADGKPLPARYNTESTLGLAVGGVVPENGTVAFALE